jgi:hypothetical protein
VSGTRLRIARGGVERVRERVYRLGVSDSCICEVSAVAVYKVNVSLPPELVAEIDEVAAELGLSRSGFITEASARYVADVRTLSAEEKRKREFDDALTHMREVGKRIPKDVDYIAIIRKFRERHGWDGVDE